MSDAIESKATPKPIDRTQPIGESTDDPVPVPSELDITAFEDHCTALVTVQSVLARATTLSAAFRLWETVKGHYGRGQAPGKAGGGKAKTDTMSFFRHMSGLIGCSEKTVRRYVRIGEAFTPTQLEQLFGTRNGFCNEFNLLYRTAELNDETQRNDVISAACEGLERARELLDALAPRPASKRHAAGAQAQIVVTLCCDSPEKLHILGAEFVVTLVASTDGTYTLELNQSKGNPEILSKGEGGDSSKIIEGPPVSQSDNFRPPSTAEVQEVKLDIVVENGIGNDTPSAQLGASDGEASASADEAAAKTLEVVKTDPESMPSPTNTVDVPVPQLIGDGPDWDLLGVARKEKLDKPLPCMDKDKDRDRFSRLFLPAAVNERKTVYGDKLALCVAKSQTRKANQLTTHAKNLGLVQFQEDDRATPGATVLVAFADKGCVARFFGVGQATQKGELPRELVFVSKDAEGKTIVFRGARTNTSLGTVHSIWVDVPQGANATKAAE